MAAKDRAKGSSVMAAGAFLRFCFWYVVDLSESREDDEWAATTCERAKVEHICKGRVGRSEEPPMVQWREATVKKPKDIKHEKRTAKGENNCCRATDEGPISALGSTESLRET